MHLTTCSPAGRKREQELKAETGAMSVEERCLLATTLAFFSLFSCTIQDHMPRVALPTVNEDLPHHSSVKKMSHRLVRRTERDSGI